VASADYAVHGNVAVIRFDNPPMNTLALAMRRAVHAHLEKAAADASVAAVVLIGGGRAFCAGAEIREFNTPVANEFPNSRDLVAAAERCPKPVVAAIHGAAMGGGLELALACHYRVAAPGAQLALPEVKLGLIPGAGGTQRLPRAVGVERALDMIITGKTVKPEAFAGTLLVDEIVPGDLEQGAVAFARTMAASAQPLRRLRDITPAMDNAAAFFAAAREKAAREQRGYPAPAEIINAIEASLKLPIDEGQKYERRCFEDLVLTTESKALRHAFFGERAVARIPGVPDDTKTLDVRSVAVVGSGLMGGGIAMALADAGIGAHLMDASAEALERGLAAIRANYAGAVARGRLSQPEVDTRLALIRPTSDWDAIRDDDMAIEAVFEDMAVKKEVFARLDAVMKPGAILASNTSSLDLDEIAATTSRPERVIGAHFFSPANVMRLLEVVRGRRTSATVLATTMKLARAMKKLAVVSGVCDGFIGNRMIDYYLRQAEYLLDEGATPPQVDRALQEFGMAMGPFALCDLVGIDIVQHMRRRRRAERPDLPYSPIADLLFAAGRLGQKTGAGYYRYDEGSRKPLPDPQTDALVEQARNDAGTAARPIKDMEIVERCVLALVNEGARILEEGIALRAVDIDMVYLAGYGFPPYRGGPMFYADTLGLSNVAATMEEFAKGYRGECWLVAPLLQRLAAEGKTFT
jgi:3-hydroxyacyl-CoA dehydrogenase